MAGRYHRFLMLFLCVCTFGLILSPGAVMAMQDGAGGAVPIGRVLPLWTIIPFVGILLSIALCPLLTPRFWHRHFGKVSAFWALLFALPAIAVYRGVAAYQIIHILLIDYVPFIILLWGFSLFPAASS